MTATLPAPSAEVQAAVAAVPGQIIAAWAAHDGPAFGDVFVEDGTMALPGVFIAGREAISGFMTRAFADPYKGTQVVGSPVNLRFVAPGVAVIVTRGGVRPTDSTELTPEQAVNATWVIVERDGEWKLAAYHNAPANPA